MKQVKKIAEKLFGKSDNTVSGGGLYATFEELMEQRKFISYIKTGNKRVSTSHQAGDIKSAFKGRGMEFEEIRPYAMGDDVRDIDWRVTARKSSPYTKLFAEERDREVYVLLDLSPKMLFGSKVELKSVSAAKIASLLARVSMENKDRFGAIVFDGEQSFRFKPQNNQAGVIAILKKISEISKQVMINRAESYADLTKSIQLMQKSIKSKAVVFVISDFIDADDNLKKNLAALGKKTELFCIDVLDVLEDTPPEDGEYFVENGKQKLVFNTYDKNFKNDYKEYFSGKRKEFKQFCNKLAGKYIEVRTDIPLYRQIKLM